MAVTLHGQVTAKTVHSSFSSVFTRVFRLQKLLIGIKLSNYFDVLTIPLTSQGQENHFSPLKLVSEQSYAKYSRKWQFCLILLPFPKVSDQLYCCFLQVFGIKLSLSLRGIKILKNLKYLVSICGRWSKISPTNLFSIKANNYLSLKPSLWASNTSDLKNSSA